MQRRKKIVQERESEGRERNLTSKHFNLLIIPPKEYYNDYL